MPGSILGNRVPRVEDPDLLLGRSQYVDDLPLDGALHLAFVRSQIAHGHLAGIDTAEAAQMPGVVAVFTADDLGLDAHHAFIALNEACKRPPLAQGKVRFVGEAVAVVAADSKAHAEDAADAVVVDIDPLPAVVDPEEALAPGAPLQFEDMGTNMAAGMAQAHDPLADADVVVRARFVNQRVAVVPLEGNAIAVKPGDDGDGHDLTVWVATQMPHLFHQLVCDILGLERDRVRVVAPHVGGAFGAKAGIAAEHTAAIGVAMRLDRPVTWTETRSENLVAMPHGRSQVQYVEMGFRHDGTITGLRCRMIGDAGAYAGFGGYLSLGPTRTMAQGVYRIPALAYGAAVALTNTTPVGAFRGAGRPEAAAFLERLIDLASDELGIDPVELRRRNLLRSDELPMTTLTGAAYDSGDYEGALDEALRLAGYDDLRAEQARRRDAGGRRQLGIGVSTYVEITAGGGSKEFGAVEVHADGRATIRVGTSAHGQGHATSFAMLVSDRLGIPLERIRFLQSDTAAVPRGGGTGGSRSLQIGGSAVASAADGVLARGRELAAERLEAAVEDIVVTDDGLGVAGVPSSAVSWSELAGQADAAGDPLAVALDFAQDGPTFPFGAHVSVVEVDVETGRVVPVRHVAVDDCGRILNPLIVEGQQHGGIAQGMAQALWEQFVYDEDGTPLTTTLMDYAMPSAAELPSFETANTETPTPLNPLGAKGIGESGTIGAMPAVQNAVIDAVRHLGVRHIEMPCSPERVWRAIQDAQAGTGPPVWRDPPKVFSELAARGGGPAPVEADVDI
ncbi:MAG: xanthine dehydrogenase family protein molybdopterin-binding subunit [Actinobacteria bacterium]|nr:xanthine dehydrogenase family protein molybdopterin-binding subunit [Actinomycetota bacterium]